MKVLDPDVIKNILEAMMESKREEIRELASQLLITVYRRSAHISAPSINQALDYSLSTTLFPLLCKAIDFDQKWIKFESLNLLGSILPEVPVDCLKKSNQLETWLGQLLSGLRQILTSKTSKTKTCDFFNYFLIKYLCRWWAKRQGDFIDRLFTPLFWTSMVIRLTCPNEIRQT